MRNKGFTLLEVLVSMFAFAFVVNASLNIYLLAAHLDLDVDFAQDINAIYQLRMMLVLGEDMEVDDEEITYRFDDDVMTLSLDERRLILKPGTNIVMDNIDYVYFERGLDEYVYMYYIRNNKERRVMICR